MATFVVILNVLVVVLSSPFRVFVLVIFLEFRTESFLQSTGVDCSDSTFQASWIFLCLILIEPCWVW